MNRKLICVCEPGEWDDNCSCGCHEPWKRRGPGLHTRDYWNQTSITIIKSRVHKGLITIGEQQSDGSTKWFSLREADIGKVINTI